MMRSYSLTFAAVTVRLVATILSLLTGDVVFAVNSASPYRTFHELLAAARARPGELTLGTVGPASLAHVAFEMLKPAKDRRSNLR